MKGVSTAIIAIHLTGKNDFFESVVQASHMLGFNRKTVQAALDSESGLIVGSDPPIYVDYACQKWDVEEYDIEDDEKDDKHKKEKM